MVDKLLTIDIDMLSGDTTEDFVDNIRDALRRARLSTRRVLIPANSDCRYEVTIALLDDTK